MDELCFLTKVLKSGEFRHVTPQDIRMSIANEWPQFKGDIQHDAHELLTCVLDSIKTHFRRSCSATKMVFEGVYESSGVKFNTTIP